MTISSQMLAVHDAAKAISDNIAEFETITDGELIESLDAALANLDPELKELRAQGGVTVRPLEWTAIMAPRSNEDPSMEETGDFDAETPFGAYTIDMGFGSDEYTWSLYFEGVSVDGVRGADDPEKLKDAAFADYRNRILSALETEAVEPVAWQSVDIDGNISITRSKSTAEAWDRNEVFVRPLYAHPLLPKGNEP